MCNLINDIQIKSSEKESKIIKDLFDYISITPFTALSEDDKNSYKNHYLVNLQRYPLYKKKKNYVKNINDVETFFSLDIDHKAHIKNFSKFNYTLQEPLSLPITTSPNSDKKNNLNANLNGVETNKAIPNHFNSLSIKPNISMTNTPIVIPESPNNNENITPFYELSPHKRRLSRPLSPLNPCRRINKKNAEWKNNLGEEYADFLKNVERPKYEMMISSFDIDANEINLVNEFVDPDPKYLQNSEYHQLDYFLSIEINSENYNKVFDPYFKIEEDILRIPEYCCVNKNINHIHNFNCREKVPDVMINNEFVEDFLLRFNNAPNKKKEHKLQLKNEEYLIFDVCEKQFYKKLKRASDDKLGIGLKNLSNNTMNTIGSLSNFNSNNNLVNLNNFNNMNSMNVNANGQNLNPNNNVNVNGDDSPKIKVKVKKLPIKIYEDHL